MLATVSNREIFISDGEKISTKSTKVANAMAIELMRHGIKPDEKLLDRIACHDVESARSICARILKMYTIGELNPPLFDQWEDRTEFTFEEFVVQIFGYLLRLSGNDLEDPAYMSQLKDNVDFKKMKRLKLAGSKKTRDRFLKLVNSKVALEKKSQRDLVQLAAIYHPIAPSQISSAEVRIAVLLGMVESGMRLIDALCELNSQPADVLRVAAAKLDFEGVKLPADVKYAALSWSDRVQLMSFLAKTPFEDLCETMGNNRTAWNRFFKHMHVFRQTDFRNRFTEVVSAGMLSVGMKQSSIPMGRLADFLKSQSKLYDVTESGNLAFRTFASRVQSAVDNQDFEQFQAEIRKRPSYLLRNIGALSNVCTRDTEEAFVEMVRKAMPNANPGVLLSIVQIDVDADYRIIDSKGNTTVTEANYSPVIGEVQRLAERELYRRHGFPGQVAVSSKLKNKVVPFLATNAELDRGTRLTFEDANYLYFLMHWVQKNGRTTDLDHSYVCFDRSWNAETIYFGNQANSFIKQSGDVTNAPAPNGATEYGRIDLKKIPDSVQYIVPIMNVYDGDVFSENEVAYAGFMFSNEAKFSIKRKHVRYDLSQPANSNIPFVIDVDSREIIIVDFNNRRRNGLTANDSIGEIKKIISALKTKKFITMDRFAKMLSGDDQSVSLTIKMNAKNETEIEPADLQSLVG